MRESLNRVLTIVKKDIKEYWILILVVLAIPVLISYMMDAKKIDNIKIGVVVNNEDNNIDLEDKSIIEYTIIDEALNDLENKKIEAVVNENDKIVYTNVKDTVVLSNIKDKISGDKYNDVR